MPLMIHKDGRRIAASNSRVDALLAEGFTIYRPAEPKPEPKPEPKKKKN